MVDSGTYTPEAIARRYEIAKLLQKQSEQPVHHWAEGLANLARAGLGGYEENQADRMERARQNQFNQTLASAFGLPAPAAVPEPPNGVERIASLFRGSDATPAATPSAPADVPPAIAPDAVAQPSPAPPPVVPQRSAALPHPGAAAGLPSPSGAIQTAPLPPPGSPAARVAGAFSDAGMPPQRGTIPAAPKVWGDDEATRAGLYGETSTGPAGNTALPPSGPAPVPPVAAPSSPAAAGGTPSPAAPGAAGTASLSSLPLDTRRQVAALLMNPSTAAVGQALLTKALSASEANQYDFATLPDGTIVRQSKRTGEVSPVYQGPTKPTYGVIGEDQFGNKQYGWIDAAKATVTPGQTGSGGGAAPGQAGSAQPTMTGPRGETLTVPTGQDPKEFRKNITEISADAAAGKFTEGQAKAVEFANRMEQAEQVIRNLAGAEDEASGIKGAALRAAGSLPLGIGGAANWFKSDKYQQYEQAKNQFITAKLRPESGATVNADEYARAEKEYFPQPGDGPAVIAQKRRARMTAIEGLKQEAGPGYRSIINKPEAAAKPAQGAPQVGDVQDGYRYKGGPPGDPNSWEKQ